MNNYSLTSYNLRSPRSNKEVSNQIVTKIGRFAIFSSYGSNIAIYDAKKRICYRNVKYVSYSRTTEKYFNIFVTEEVCTKEVVTLSSTDFDLMETKIELKLQEVE
jgi:hypothetical protein